MNDKFHELKGCSEDVFTANRVRAKTYRRLLGELDFLSSVNPEIRERRVELESIIFRALDRVETDGWLLPNIEEPLVTIRHALDYLKWKHS